MENLIRISTTKNGTEVVSARELYAILEVSERFSRWFDRMITYGFILDVDFSPYQMVHPTANAELTDFAMTTDMAKEVGMLQKSEKGKEVRMFFIQRDKALAAKNTLSQLPDFTNPVEAARAWANELEAKNNALKQLEIAQPKIDFVDAVLLSTSNFTTTTIAAELGMSAIKLNRELCAKGIQRKHNGAYVLYAKYQGKGYTTTRTHVHVGNDGSNKTTLNLVWQERGRVFLHNLFNPELKWSQASKNLQQNAT